MLRCSGCGRLFPRSPGEGDSCPECGAALAEDPHAYLPQRFQSGTFKPEGFEITQREKKELVPWDKIRLLCLGIVEEPALQVHPNVYMQLKQVVKKAFSREKREDAPPVRQNVYLEIFVEDIPQPYRGEASNLDYRSLLEKVEYISENNFRKFLRRLEERLTNCQFNDGFFAFLENKKSAMKRFGNIYEFQRDCQEMWQKIKAEET